MIIQMALPMGETVQEMRENIRETPLHRIGDARLMWVNEGDLGIGQMQGRVEILRTPRRRMFDRFRNDFAYS
jgi:hypothetical protein